MSKTIEKIKSTAEELREVRGLIADLKTETQDKMIVLEARRDELEDNLILGFKKEGLTSIKTESGESCTLMKRKGIEVTSDIHALKWCVENRAVSINKTLAKQKLEPIMKKAGKLPDGFEYKEIEYISVRKPKVKDAEGEAPTE